MGLSPTEVIEGYEMAAEKALDILPSEDVDFACSVVVRSWSCADTKKHEAIAVSLMPLSEMANLCVLVVTPCTIDLKFACYKTTKFLC